MLTVIVLALGYNSIDKNRALTTVRLHIERIERIQDHSVRLHIEHIELELLNAFTWST